MKKILFIASAFLFVLASCKNNKQPQLSKDEYYTCSMHPQVVEDHPGNCPICHMKLIVVKKTNTAPGEIMLNDEQIELGNIKVDTLRNGVIGDNMTLTATMNADETKVNSVNARIAGRIDHLYFKNAGDYVPKGAHLYDLYSEELNVAKQEYLAALERKETLDNSIIDFDRLIKSAKTKLLLWGMTERQITDLAKTKMASSLTAFYSPVSGYISDLPVTEGQYVMEGSTVVRLADLSSLWAEAQVYASQLSAIDQNGTATVQLPDLPGKEFKGKIEFVNPEIADNSRVDLVRVVVPNAGGILKPGMPAYVIIKNKEVKTLTLPLDAVLRNGKMDMVWTQVGRNNFKSVMVQTGLETGNTIEIKSGLKQGDVIVVSGAYLLNSEFIFQKGANAMAGMEGMKM